MKHWADIDNFPASNESCAVLKNGNIVSHDCHALRQMASRSWIVDRRLFCGQSADRFLPALCEPDLGPIAHRGILQYARVVLVLVVVAIIAVVLLSIGHDHPESLHNTAIAFVAVLAFLAFDYLFIKRRIDRLQERALYFHLLMREGKDLLLAFSMVMVLAGGAQVIFVSEYGSFEDLVLMMGVHFDAIASGEFWRHLTGPFIHSGMSHWFANFIILGLAVGIAIPIGKWWTVAMFVLTLVGAGLSAQFLPFGERPDAIVGVSGATFGLLGGISVVALRFSREFPQLFGTSILAFLAVNVCVSLLVPNNTNQLVHLGGAATGFVLGLFFPRKLPFSRQDSASIAPRTVVDIQHGGD